MSLGLWARSGSSPLTRGKLRAFWRRRSRLRLIPAHAGKTNTASRSPTRTRAHPRSRGENHENVGLDKTIGGSSPLTRGKRCQLLSFPFLHRLIPAHAGKTLTFPGRVPQLGAHPRSRGENLISIASVTSPCGSSPLTRGKPHCTPLSPRVTRLIPAHAGKTPTVAVGETGRAAHPRSRGENSTSSSSQRTGGGSSPLTRGKPRVGRRRRARLRLIPAHAGKTPTSRAAASQAGAHPRSRGENTPSAWSPGSLHGSSPLTRGKRVACGDSGVAVWLIPAHAGKTSSGDCRAYPAWAHPRSRGENPGATHEVWTRAGSSPLTRGKPCAGSRTPYTWRLIPAHAGKTSMATDAVSPHSAHPRSRGENSALAISPGTNTGSSPLTRGKHMFNLEAPQMHRLIPAHAGKTL